MQRSSQPRHGSADATISRQVAGLCLRETLYPSKLKMARHGHHLAAIGIVLKGRYIERVGKQTRWCGPGSVVFHPPGEEHAVEFYDERVRIFRVDFPSDWLTRLRERSAVLDSPCEIRGGRAAGLALQLYREFKATDTRRAACHPRPRAPDAG